MALAGWPDDIDDDGTGQTGTIHNAAFSDAEEAAIEAYVVSPTNPTVSPADIIDEVVEAREGEASLKDRIDAVEAEIGVGSVSEATVEALLGAGNVARNGDFEDWDDLLGLGGADSLVDWGVSGTGAVLERTGIGETDTFHFGTSGYAAKVTRGVAAAVLNQDVLAGGVIAAYSNIKGQKISASVKCKSSVASQAYIRINDGITSSDSAFHTGGGTEEHLTVTHTISGSATFLEIELHVDQLGGGVYWGGVQYEFSPLPASDWQPFTGFRPANESHRGVISLAAQTMGRGVKTFTRPPAYAPGNFDPVGAGGLSVVAVVSGRLDSQFADVGNSGAGPDDLMSYNLRGTAFELNGRALRITAWGIFAANANAKKVIFNFGGVASINTESLAFNGEDWRIDLMIVRVSNTTIRMSASFKIGTDTAIVATENYLIQSAIAGFDFANNDYTLKVQAQGVAGNDVVQKAMITEAIG